MAPYFVDLDIIAQQNGFVKSFYAKLFFIFAPFAVYAKNAARVYAFYLQGFCILNPKAEKPLG